MAYNSCAASIAANIDRNCSTPLTGGYTGRGLLIDIAAIQSITQDGTNPRIITLITIKTGKKIAAINNSAMEQPLTGSTTQSNTDDGMVKYRKTVVLNIPRRGGDASKDIVEPTYQSALGYIAVLEKKDRSGDGSFEVIGFEQALKANPDGIVRNEYENGGSTIVTMSCNETNFENVLFDTDYETSLHLFEGMLINDTF